MFVALPLLLAVAAAVSDCSYDHTTLTAGIDAFDQDMHGGWRALAATPGCTAKAADMLRYYRERVEGRIGTLYWHEGQLRAELGDVKTATELFERARHLSDDDGWNDYVDATIAFLRHDRATLLAARERLAKRPKPADRHFSDATGAPIADPPWPPNLAIVDGLIACFSQGYRDAYRCSASIKSPNG